MPVRCGRRCGGYLWDSGVEPKCTVVMRMICVHVVTDKNTNNEIVCSETFRDSIHKEVWKLLTGEWWCDGVGGNVLVGFMLNTQMMQHFQLHGEKGASIESQKTLQLTSCDHTKNYPW